LIRRGLARDVLSEQRGDGVHELMRREPHDASRDDRALVARLARRAGITRRAARVAATADSGTPRAADSARPRGGALAALGKVRYLPTSETVKYEG
jgi:hypothetical protein